MNNSKKGNLGASILFGEAVARVEHILAMIDEFNEISDALSDLGYMGEDLGDWGIAPMPRIELTGGNFNIDDAGFLADSFNNGPQKREVATVGRRQPLFREKNRLGKESGWKCFYCGCAGTQERGPDERVWHVDHAYPILYGGDDQPDNLVLSCATCNLEKRAKTAAEYFKARAAREAQSLTAVSKKASA